MHYQRWRKHGSPNKQRATLVERFNDKIDKTVDCWQWTAARNDYGYGVFYTNGAFSAGRYEYAHRIMFWLHGGKLKPNEVVDHKCGNGAKGCVNPKHLRPLDRSENCAQGGFSQRKVWCETHDQARIYNAKRQGYTCRQCAKDYYYRKKATKK